MYMNAMRMRIGAIIAGILLVGIYLLAGGPFDTGGKSVILIEFGMYPEEFEGLEVLIDGEPAGTLKKLGAATRTGFKVRDGNHVVEVLHESIGCEPRRVTSGRGGRTVVLILDVESRRGESGETEPFLVFNT